MVKEQLIVIRDGGKIEMIMDGEVSTAIIGDSDKTIRRASHVEPINWLLRRVFHLLRGHFGEEGKVASWTRNWNCVWRVNMTPSNGPIFGTFDDRDQALDAEVNWLNTNYLK